jgi:hypothetical protein
VKYTLTLHAEGGTRDGPVYGSGIVTKYRVGGMPVGEQAEIANWGAPNRNDWQILRIKNDTQGDWTGHYESADAALAVIQKEFD